MLNTPLRRSFAGLAIAAPLVPLLLALLACLPFPIGDPEHSQVDPGLTGAWIGENEHGPEVLVLRPYDSRTWLVLALGASGDPEVGKEPQPAASADAKDPGALLARMLDPRSDMEGVSLYKAWLTTLGGRRFLCLEPLTAITNEGHFQAEVWIVASADTPAAEELTLRWPADKPPWADVKTKEEAEALLRTHANDEAFFPSQDGYVRISPVHYPRLQDLFRRFGLNAD
jgi:hypothetical protein